jgi:hypothetical protein
MDGPLSMSATESRAAIIVGSQGESLACREPLVAVVILNWREPGATVACVQALRGLDYANKRIVVVDNGSDPARWRR